MTYVEIAKALIQTANNKARNGNCFDFTNMEKLAEQLKEIFVLKKTKVSKVTLKNVATYIKEMK